MLIFRFSIIAKQRYYSLYNSTTMSDAFITLSADLRHRIKYQSDLFSVREASIAVDNVVYPGELLDVTRFLRNGVTLYMG